MLGKFVISERALARSGLAVLIFASALITFGRRNAATCKVCDNNNAVVMGENHYGKEES
jgi:hypothetical protein